MLRRNLLGGLSILAAGTWTAPVALGQDAAGDYPSKVVTFVCPIATGEMLTSVAEHHELIKNNSVDFIQPDAPRVGGITQFLKICSLAEQKGLKLAPHYVMEVHLHVTAAYSREPWVEHFEWSEPMWNERLEIRDGRMIVPNRPGLGLSLSEQARAWTAEQAEFGKRP